MSEGYGDLSLKRLDEILTALNQVNQTNTEILTRLTRMEVKQSGQASEIHHQHEQLKELSGRISKVEIELAVHGANTSATSNQLYKRWAALGALAIVVLGAVSSAVGTAMVSAWDNKPSQQERRYDPRQNTPYDASPYDNGRMREPAE